MNKLDIEPTKGYVLVELFEAPKEVGGLVLAGDQQNTAPVRGKVIRVSNQPLFSVGDEIFFRKYAIDELKFTNEQAEEEVVFLIGEDDVLGTVKPLAVKEEKDPKEIRKVIREQEEKEERKRIKDEEKKLKDKNKRHGK